MGAAYNPALDEDLKLLKKWDSSDGVYTFDPARTPFDQPLSKVLDPYFRELNQPIDIGKRDKYGRIAYGRTQGDVDKVIQQYAEALTLSPTGMAKIKQYAMQHPELADKSSVDIAKALMNDYGQKYIGTKRWGAAAPAWAVRGSGANLPSFGRTGYLQTASISDIKSYHNVNRRLDEMKSRLDELPRGSDEYNALTNKIDEYNTYISDYRNKIDNLLKEDLNKETIENIAIDAVKRGYAIDKNEAAKYLMDLISGKESPYGGEDVSAQAMLNPANKIRSDWWNKQIRSIIRNKDIKTKIEDYKKDLVKNLSETSAAYKTIGIPIYTDNSGISYQTAADGKSKIVSPLGAFGKEFINNPDDFNVINFDGNFRFKTDDLKKQLNKPNTKITAYNPIIDLNGIYSPTDSGVKLEIVFKNDKGTHSVIVSPGKMNSSLMNNIYEASMSSGDYDTPLTIQAIRNEQIPWQFNRTRLSNIGDEVTIKVPGLRTINDEFQYKVIKEKPEKRLEEKPSYGGKKPFEYKIVAGYKNGQQEVIGRVSNRNQALQQMIADYNRRAYQIYILPRLYNQ